MSAYHAVTVHLPADLYARLVREAARDDDTLAEWIGGAVVNRLRARLPVAERKGLRLITCRHCLRQRLHRARGLCRRCYPHAPDVRPVACCARCHRERPLRGRGLCASCYESLRRTGQLAPYRLRRRARQVA
jgi:hypothetical protein